MVLPSDTTRLAESAQIANPEGSPEGKPNNKQKKAIENRKGRNNSKRSRGDTMVRKDHVFFQFSILDIIFEILLRLPMEEILRCRSVCKDWYRITKYPSFINRQRNILSQEPPRLICRPLNRLLANEDQLIVWNSEEGKTRKMPLTESFIGNGEIVFSHDGVLCIAPKKRENRTSLIICNPITKEWIRLPGTNNVKNLLDTRVGFCFVPAQQKHIVVQFIFTSNKLSSGRRQVITSCYILTSEQPSWRLITHPRCIDTDCFMGSTLYWNDVFHWKVSVFRPGSHTKGILSFDTTRQTFEVKLIPWHSIGFPWHSTAIGIMNGCLALAGRHDNKIKIWDLKEDRVGELSVVCRKCYGIDTSQFRLLFGLTNNEHLLMRLLNKVCTGFAVGSNDLQQLRSLNIDGLPDQFRVFFYKPSLVSVYSMGFPGYQPRS